MRQVFTAADIRRLRDQGTSVLVLGQTDLISPEALDVAREASIEVKRPGSTPAPAAQPAAPSPLPPLKAVRRLGVSLEPFGAGLATPGTNVQLKDVITSGDRTPMAVGYMSLERGEFPWTLTYDEIDIVLEGELVIRRGDEAVSGGPGDVIFIPKGSRITFGSPSRARFVYVTYPADWNK